MQRVSGGIRNRDWPQREVEWITNRSGAQLVLKLLIYKITAAAIDTFVISDTSNILNPHQCMESYNVLCVSFYEFMKSFKYFHHYWDQVWDFLVVIIPQYTTSRCLLPLKKVIIQIYLIKCFFFFIFRLK